MAKGKRGGRGLAFYGISTVVRRVIDLCVATSLLRLRRQAAALGLLSLRQNDFNLLHSGSFVFYLMRQFIRLEL